MTGAGPRIGSLFSGVGGLDLAIRDALGGETVFVADVCKFTENKKTGTVTIGHHEPHRSPCSVLAHRFPDAPNLGDVSLIDWGPCPATARVGSIEAADRHGPGGGMTTYSRPSSQTSIMSRICFEASVPSSAHASMNASQRSSSMRTFRSVVPRGTYPTSPGNPGLLTLAWTKTAPVGKWAWLPSSSQMRASSNCAKASAMTASICSWVASSSTRKSNLTLTERGISYLRSLVCRYTLTRGVGTRQEVRSNFLEVAA